MTRPALAAIVAGALALLATAITLVPADRVRTPTLASRRDDVRASEADEAPDAPVTTPDERPPTDSRRPRPGSSGASRAMTGGETANALGREEAAVMARLHTLAETDPALSLRLARDGNARFPTSPDAAERGWIVVKSLVDMMRFDEAKAEAEAMVARYAGTPWADDVARHLLVNPLFPDPSESDLDGAGVEPRAP